MKMKLTNSFHNTETTIRNPEILDTLPALAYCGHPADPATKAAKAVEAKAVETKADHKIMSVKQTTDAAALAAIDTSGYVLPGTRVDVVAVVNPTQNAPDVTSKVILTNVQVLAAGTKIEQDGEQKPLIPSWGTGWGVRMLNRLVADNYEK